MAEKEKKVIEDSFKEEPFVEENKEEKQTEGKEEKQEKVEEKAEKGKSSADETTHKKADKKAKGKVKNTEAEIAAAKNQAEKAEAKAKEIAENLVRTAAEYDNFRKRTQKEMESAFSRGVMHAAEELLPVLDTLDAAANAPCEDEKYKQGVIMTLTKAKEVFEALGICEIKALGEEFDPDLHNAVMQEETEGVASGTITRVMQKGYILGDKVLRYTMVAVAS